jgi:DNA modification methylase
VKDAFTRIWWLSKTPYPKADNRRVLVPYSKSMEDLLKKQRYNAGTRPSEHKISETSFLKNNGGAIPSNVFVPPSFEPENLLVGYNTTNTDSYSTYCRARGLTPHPARMPSSIADFFINLCTDPGDLVLDPFGGSNTTGASAEALQRHWLVMEQLKDYAEAGIGRFPKLWGNEPAAPSQQEVLLL